MKHRFTAEAVADYEHAVVYYETREPGLGARFILEVDDVIATVLEFPFLGAKVDGAPEELGLRRALVQSFGVELAYMLRGSEEVVIVAVFHGSREPGFWLERVLR